MQRVQHTPDEHVPTTFLSKEEQDSHFSFKDAQRKRAVIVLTCSITPSWLRHSPRQKAETLSFSHSEATGCSVTEEAEVP